MLEKTDTPSTSLIEIEQKFRLIDPAALEQRLTQMGATELRCEVHADTYFRHPSKDFAETREALRIRRVAAPAADFVRLPGQSSWDTQSMQHETFVTYKGPYSSPGIKARPELEWRIDPSDPDGQNQEKLLKYLGFSPVMTVRKLRRSFSVLLDGRRLTVTIDEAEGLGTYAEIETLASDPAEIQACRDLVGHLATSLELFELERRSYLVMALAALVSSPA